MYTNMVFGAAKAVLFNEVSSLQGVLITCIHYVVVIHAYSLDVYSPQKML